MIPIKWNGEYWVITTADNSEWYDYSNGKWANVMLSDGIYSSELERNKKLASDYVEKPITSTEELGTIFTWIPRLAYMEDNISFLKGTSIVEYMYTTEECFNLIGYGANKLDLAFEGIWVGQAELGNVSQVEQKNNEMNSKENTYGLISNEKVQMLTSSDKKAVEKLYSKYSITNNKTILQNIETMQNRQTIKIINTNKRIPISGTHQIVGDSIIINTRYSEKDIEYCTDKNGNKLENTHIAKIDEEEVNYTFYIVDQIGNIRKYTMSYGGGKPYLKGFNKNNTFYVVYNDGVPDTSIPIGESAPANWYDYENQMWANIVCRENGQELYYTWIPRYMYKLDDANQSVEAIIVDLENKDIKTGEVVNSEEYTLPDAFSWGSDGNKVQLTGYWISKYKLRDNTTYNPDIYGLSGVINIDGVVSQFGNGYTYEAYLIKDGKRIVKNEDGEYVEGTEPVKISGNDKFTKVPAGDYTVNVIIKDSAGNDIQGITKAVTVGEKVPENKPNLTKYNINNTFYVVYDSVGNETSYIPIGHIGQEEVKNWYDYDEDKKATIVVKDNGRETYYEWIPRYEYLNSNNSHIRYILTEQVTADTGYTIPKEFTDEGGNALNGYWKQKATYSNRIQANESAGSDKILITNITMPSNATKYDIYLIQEGKIIEQENDVTENSYTYTNLSKGKYVVEIIAKDTNGKTLAGYTEDQIVTEIKVDLTGFNKSNTFYVVYDEEGNVDSTIPIGEDEPTNWYDYTTQQWANIVVRDNGQELYYTYIPRYEYKLNDALQKTKAMFIPIEQSVDEGYTIPDAFIWESDEETRQLPGYWISKYKLRDNSSYTPDIYGLGGIIRIDNVVSHFGNSYTYEAYLINDEGKRIVKNADKNYVEGNTPVAITGNYRFTNIQEGNYTVNIILKDSAGREVQGIAKYVTVLPKVQENKPDLSQYNPNTTYFVMPNTAKEIGTVIPIGEDIPDGWYDYDEDIKATIVTRINGQETFYEWIPRYQQKTSDSSYISYIPTTKTEADEGYTIPSIFTGDKADGYWKQISTASANSSYTPDIYGVGGTIHIEKIATSGYTYEAYLIKDGKRIVQNSAGNYVEGTNPKPITANDKYTGVPKGEYTVNVIIKNTSGIYQIGFTKTVIVLEKIEAYGPDLSQLNINTTFFVTHNILGIENESINPIGQDIPENWYDYDEKKNATVIVRENGQETYYEWIPRYQYQNGHTDWISYISTDQPADEGYTIPSEFTDSNGNALRGYWKQTTQYTNRMYANIAAGDDKIVISNVKTSSSALLYNVYLIKDGTVVNSGTISDTYTFGGLTQGTYGVLVTSSDGTGIGATKAGYAQVVNVGVMEIPDVIGYMVDTTYIVVYDSDGNEYATQSLRSVLSNDAVVNADGALVSGKIDLAKINGTWYDYAEQRWANIVTINSGKTLYFTWIPRYEYMLNDDNQATYARFIPKTQVNPDTGYQIPESFAWESDAGKVELSGYWISKYKLRD